MLKKAGIILVVGALVFGLSKFSFAMSCGDHSNNMQMAQADTTHQDEMASNGATPVAKEAVNMGNKICPVSGQEIDEKFKATYEYEGKIYNFCCGMCIDTFKSNPVKYIKKVEDELAKQKVQEEDVAPIPEMPVSHQHAH